MGGRRRVAGDGMLGPDRLHGYAEPITLASIAKYLDALTAIRAFSECLTVSFA